MDTTHAGRPQEGQRMQVISRHHDICAGHRVVGHGGKCKNIHGHQYRITFVVTAEELDKLGMVIDFGEIKGRLCQWLEEEWDHRLLLWEKDPWLPQLRDIDPSVVSLPVNPTAENLANLLLYTVGPHRLAGTGVRLISCRVQETEKCCALATLTGVSKEVDAAFAQAI
jgi:6-pyruvoyltetrahydropterin/6-carboxytetrahydropterin synthase